MSETTITPEALRILAESLELDAATVGEATSALRAAADEIERLQSDVTELMAAANEALNDPGPQAMTMLEKMARAICKSAYGKSPGSDPENWERFADLYWMNHLDGARAALQAMLEPSEGMVAAGKECWPPRSFPTKASFRAMIQAALEGK